MNTALKCWLETTFGWWLSDYRWFRKWQGGHWERWFVDCVYASVWFRMEHCSKPFAPHSLCRWATCPCEDW